MTPFWKKELFAFDERAIQHRYYSTRLSAIIGMVMLLGAFLYAQFVQQELRWDLFIIAVVMALVKLVAMAYFQKTH